MPADYPIILHHFDASPFSEKIRLTFGLKKLEWTSVLISRIMPRPDLMPMTGGYRRTPVMQIGADIYCDTQCILRELDRRFPHPPLLPQALPGLAWAVGMWTDRAFFQNTVGLVFGSLADKVPADFIADRSALRGVAFDVAAMSAAIPQSRDQFRAHVQWIDAQLDGRNWFDGERATLLDISAYMNVWYVLQNLPYGDAWLAEFPNVMAWVTRMSAIGHGSRTEMSAADALALGAKAEPRSIPQADANDPNGRKPGDHVTVADDAGIAVAGKIVSLSSQHIAIRRHDPIAGDIVVHFPRAGMVVKDAR